MVPVLVRAVSEIFASGGACHVLLLNELALLTFFRHKQYIRSDLLGDIQQNLQVAVAHLREEFDDRRKVGQTNLLSGLGVVDREYLVDDLEEFLDSLV